MNKTYYTIYKTTNKLNGKYYIGKHQTNYLDDGYMGSGKLLKRAITKYGIENFVKEILHIFDNEYTMNLMEQKLVVPNNPLSYNLCYGGHGGFSYINQDILNTEKRKVNGAIGGHQAWRGQKRHQLVKRMMRFYRNPDNRCKMCQKKLRYDTQRWEGKFCSRSCGATFNNNLRLNITQGENTC